MKKLFTLLCLVATVCSVSAQGANKALNAPASGKLTPAPAFSKKAFTNSSRAADYALALDYDGLDEQFATDIGADYQRFIWDINRKYSNADNFNMDYAAVVFDTLMYYDQNTSSYGFYPKAKSTVTVDSFAILFIHTHTTNNPDTLTFTVFNKAQSTVTGYGTPGAVYTTPKLWDTTIIVNTTIPLNSQNFTVATFYPGVALNQGESFGIRVDFAGDTANKFQILGGYRDECADACAGQISIAGNNSIYYLNLTQQTTNLSGHYENFGPGGAIFFDCDQSGGFTPAGCENFYIQNWVIIPYITASVQYGATIVADSLRGCPGAQLNLKANAFGSDAPYTYSWNTTSGSLSSTTDEEVSLNIGTSNAVVTVTVTDANNQTVLATVNVQSRGINVAITNPTNPIVLNCGANATITTQISGTTNGKFYTWSTGASGTNQATISVSQPGNYKVTVTNNSGCSASAAVNVEYPGGLANTVSFQPQAGPYCAGKQVNFTNTSTRTAGWNYKWTYGDGNLGFGKDGSNTFANPGVYGVKLEQDSASCAFTSPTQNITVLASSNAACINSGVEDVTFGNSISVQPNPSNGNVNIIVNAAENNLNIRVYNILGSEVKSFHTSDATTSFTKNFDFSDLSNGTYLVKIQSGDKTAVKKLTISK